MSSVTDETPHQNGSNGISRDEELDFDIGDAGGQGHTSSGGTPTKYARMPTRGEDNKYNMNHPRRGYCVIFNNKVFDPHLNLGERSGTDRDRDQMRYVFSKLGFDVKIYNDKTAGEIHQVIENMSCGEEETRNHSNSDCLVMFFMSHGEDGVLYGRDRQYKIDSIFEQFTANQCPSLAGKPKLFFVQACRGDNLDAGTTLVSTKHLDETDSGHVSYKIPNSADFLICFSTVSGHYSWRNTTNGSWFIQSIASVFGSEARHDDGDVLSMMTSVNRKMILHFESNCPSSPGMHGKKQSACMVNTLMRKIYFHPKH